MNKIVAFLVSFVILTAPACTQAKHVEQVVKTDAIECAKQDLGQTVPQAGLSLLMVVAGIVFNGGTDWHSDLDALAAKYGPEALACAAKIAKDLFATPAEGSGAGPSTSEGIESPAQRAQEALAKYSLGRAIK